MAKKEKEGKISKNRVNSFIQNIQSNMDLLYKNTYITPSNNSKDLENIKSNIDNTLDSIMTNTSNDTGISNLSTLYNRLSNKGNFSSTNKITSEIENLFEDKALTDSLATMFSDNKNITIYDEEIDILCKYMPTLEDALEAKKDNVLSADHFTKDFLNIVNTSNTKLDSTFSERVKEIKRKYRLIDLIEESYDNTAHYGEQFIYICPYNKAFSKLLAAKNNVINTGYTNESVIINEGVVDKQINLEAMINEDKNIENKQEFINELKDNNVKLNIQLGAIGVLESAINNHTKAKEAIERNMKSAKFDKLFKNDEIEFEGLDGSIDGLITKDKKDKDIKTEVTGCIIKKLKRENVIPLYIDDLCLGYYVLEMDYNNMFSSQNALQDPSLSLKAGGKMTNTDYSNQLKRDSMLRYLSGQLSNYIDASFINNNQDLKEEIYTLLKYNDVFNSKEIQQLRVTFIPPENMIHMYFKKNPLTNRGISDLDRSILPAKLYTSLYITTWTGIVTRSNDKRVYYVKQNIDTNISKVLLNTINQIKKSNLGSREMANTKNLFNIVGKFNDFVIPIGASGDSPMNFEIMQGQNIEVKTELFDILEQMAINATDVPYDYIQSRKNADYAVRLTMASGKFLRKVFKRQSKLENYISDMVTTVYNSEYNEDDILEVELPPPSFLSTINTNQVIQTTNETIENIVNMEMGDEDDEKVKSKFRRKLQRHYFGGYLDIKNIDSLKKEAYMEYNIEKTNREE